MPDAKELREQLAKVIDGLRLTSPAHAGVVADHLLPVVERYAAQRAAEALWEAADDLDDGGEESDPAYIGGAQMLRARAAALAADYREPHPAHRHDETGAGRG